MTRMDRDAAFWIRVEEILEIALREPPNAVAEAVSSACRGDRELELEVLSLLGHLPDAEAAEALEPEPSQPVARIEALEGRRLGGFKLEALMGRGVHGVVYRGQQMNPDRLVAVKVIDIPDRRFRRARGEILRRFEHEVAVISHLDVPGIARVISAGIDSSTGEALPYIVTDFVEDPRDLARWWAEVADDDRRLAILEQIVRTVQSAHDVGVLHRDLKPANILVDAEDRSRVIDFGISTIVGIETGTTVAAGSLGFASPEQLDPSSPQSTVRSDVHALGRIIGSLLDTDPLGRHRLTADLRAVAEKSAARDPEERYPTAEALGLELRRLRDGFPPDAAKPGWPRRSLAVLRRHPAEAALAFLLLATVSVLGGLLVEAKFRVLEENTRLEASLEAEEQVRFGLQLAAIGAMEDDPLGARRALTQIEPDRDGFAIRYFRQRLGSDRSGFLDSAENAYRIRATPDGRHLVTGGAHAVRLFEVPDREPIRSWTDIGSQVYAVAIAPDAGRVVAGTEDGRAFLIDLDDPDVAEPVQVEGYEGGVVLGAAFHPSGRAAMLVGGDGNVHWLDLRRTPVEVTVIPVGVDTRWCSIDAAPSGGRIVVAGYDGRFALLDVPTDGNPPRATDLAWGERSDQRIRTIRFSPDGRSIAMTAADRVSVADADGRLLRSRRMPTNSLWGLSWSPTGDRIAVSGWDQLLRVLDAGSLEEWHHQFGADGPVWSIAWPTDLLIGTGEENAAIRWWDSEPLGNPNIALPSPACDAVAGPAGSILVAVDDGAMLRVRPDAGTVDVVVPSVDPGPEGSTLARGAIDAGGFHRIVGDRLESFDLEGRPIRSVVLDRVSGRTTLWKDPGGDRFAARLDDHLVLIEGSTGDIRFESPFRGLAGRNAGFDEQGRFHFASGFDADLQGLHRIDPATGVAERILDRNASNLRAAHRIPDGWLTASATNDAFRFSPSESREEWIEVDFAHAGGTNVFRTIDGGRTLVTGGTDGLVRLWALPEFTLQLRIKGRTSASVRMLEVLDEGSIVIGRNDDTIQVVEARARD